MPERFRGELLTIGRYTNPAFFTFYLLICYGFARPGGIDQNILYPLYHQYQPIIISFSDMRKGRREVEELVQSFCGRMPFLSPTSAGRKTVLSNVHP